MLACERMADLRLRSDVVNDQQCAFSSERLIDDQVSLRIVGGLVGSSGLFMPSLTGERRGHVHSLIVLQLSSADCS
jgi:hypothetical protein